MNISREKATALVADIRAYLGANPADDSEWMAMMDALTRIEDVFAEILAAYEVG